MTLHTTHDLPDYLCFVLGICLTIGRARPVDIPFCGVARYLGTWETDTIHLCTFSVISWPLPPAEIPPSVYFSILTARIIWYQ